MHEAAPHAEGPAWEAVEACVAVVEAVVCAAAAVADAAVVVVDGANAADKLLNMPPETQSGPEHVPRNGDQYGVAQKVQL